MLTTVLLTVIALMSRHAAAKCSDTVVSSGGLPCLVENGACCDCLDTPGAERCLWDVTATWCASPMLCVEGTCITPPAPVVDQSGGCGEIGLKCCPGGVCLGESLACASGSCVDVTSDVLDQTTCGLEATPCCGYYEDCDEELLCLEGVCSAP